MKRVKSLIKLTNRKPESLNEKEQSLVIGGNCGCGCFYSDCGGSSSEDNAEANQIGSPDGLHSPVPWHAEEWNYAN